MLAYLQYRWALWRVISCRRRTAKIYKAQLAHAIKSRAGRDAVEGIKYDQHHELSMLDDEIETLASQYLLSIAHRLLVPIPHYQEEGGAWERSSYTGTAYLTREGMKALRQEIREEEQARQRGLLAWTSAAIGVIGAFTGLAAVVLKG
ncbi:hypothetical protein [Stutzerimonas nitrititolerans]|uniref:hypothetical protein n=1 Tax=Stutzerimonas nitrititolerans TaxID=2482751 RepID=UPI00289FCB9D|nr:hypothetical protein [Stutzerimonas nitrititolerans]